MMCARVLTAVVLLATTAVAARPQEVSTPAVRLTLEEAMARAKEQSAHLAQLRSLETASTEALRGARAARRPVLDLSAGYARNSDVPELTLAFPGLPPRTLFPNIPNNYRTRAGLTLPLWSGGRIEGAIQAAILSRAAASEDLEAGEADLALETAGAYWRLVTSREAERVLRKAVASFEAHYTDSQNRFESGLAARNEVLSILVEKDRAELTLLRARNGAEIASADLARLTGIPFGTAIEPAEPLEGGSSGEETLDALVATALAARPDVLAVRKRVAAIEANARVAQSVTRPQVNVSAAYEYARPNPRVLPAVNAWNDTWGLGLALSFSAFDGGRASAAVAEIRARAEAARHQLEDLERGVRLEVTSRRLELEAAREAIAVAERGVEAATENLRIVQDRFAEGLIPSSERLDAETSLLRASLDRTEAAAQWRLALARLDRAVGR